MPERTAWHEAHAIERWSEQANVMRIVIRRARIASSRKRWKVRMSRPGSSPRRRRSSFFENPDAEQRCKSAATPRTRRADNHARTVLGATKLQWLDATLLKAQQGRIPWKLVAIAAPIDQVGGAPVQDGKSWWGGYRAERDRLLKFIANNRIGHVVFLTTDDHQTLVSQLQYLTNPGDPNRKPLLTDGFQVVTGPIGAGGLDKFADHSFVAIQIAANRANERQVSQGQPLRSVCRRVSPDCTGSSGKGTPMLRRRRRRSTSIRRTRSSTPC